MKYRQCLQAAFVIAALGASVPALNAQGFNVFGMGTGSSLFDSVNYTVAPGDFNSEYHAGGGFTVGGTVPFLASFIGLEGSYSLLRNNLSLTNNSLSPYFESAYGIRNQRLSGDLVVHFPHPVFHVQPYVAAGIEYDRFTPLLTASGSVPYFGGYTNVRLDDNNRFGENFGGGIDYRIWHHLSLRLDVRDHLVGSPEYGLSSSYSNPGPIYPVSREAQDLTYSLGIVFHSGK